MTAILGISAFYHDSAAALVIDGRIVAAAQEERFTRKKHDPDFPSRSIAYCLEEAGLRTEDLDYVAFYDKPLSKFERLLETYLAVAPRGFHSFRMAMPVWLKDKLHTRSMILQALGKGLKARLVFTEHHESHAASAFFPSPFDEAAILTLDGVGEWSTTVRGTGSGNKIDLTEEIRFPHSLGLLYSAFTYYCGFKVNSGEYKLMGLAPYGRPIYADAIFKHLIDLKSDGSFRLEMDYFEYARGLTMTGDRFNALFGGPARKPETDLEPRHMDLAASIQAVTEEIVLRLARELHRKTAQKNLVLAGGVALNCVANGRLLREGPFDAIWIQPAAGDAGGALGAALFVWHQLMGRPRRADPGDTQQGSFLGPRHGPEDVGRFLGKHGVEGRRFDDLSELDAYVAEQLADGKVVGWFQGRMEFGPRSLGARSILGDPRSPKMQSTMNLKIKFRESFRPFAPCVLAEHAHEWFDLKAGQESPYMLLVADVLQEKRVPLDDADRATMEQDPDLRRRVNVVRSEIPAVTHVDYSARIQTVDARRNPRLHGLLEAFHRRTGCPVLINTSFNVRGEPIVCMHEDAYRCFQATAMDVLVLEDTVIVKPDRPQEVDGAALQGYLAQFPLD
ncbi:carbamoyltransferase [Singulisphaera sp. PoT]|uniref:carbamoyltransferase family protein n=1 Tax=Singulisphaera sp. PoT TaxID=3411797 RepID=UPI003BF4C466